MKCVSSKLTGISSKMVYRYSHAPTLWSHGCVLVQYKSHISWEGSNREAEWSPIQQVQSQVPQLLPRVLVCS